MNSQWLLPGAALLKVRYPLDPRISHDPSQMLRGFTCLGPVSHPLTTRLRTLQRGRWDYLWVLETRGTDPWPGRTALYRDANSALYRLPPHSRSDG